MWDYPLNLCASEIHIILSKTTISSIIFFFNWGLLFEAETAVARDDRGNLSGAWVNSNGHSLPLEAETEAASWAGCLGLD